jgi:hypothetical protein
MKAGHFILGCFLRLIKRKRKINNDDIIPPVEFTRGIAISARKGGHQPSALGFISDVMGTGEPGILLHGNESGTVGYYNHLQGFPGRQLNPQPNFIKNPADLYEQIKEKCGVDLKTFKRGKPLHFIICFGNAHNSMAQPLANFLNRPVICYGTSEGPGGTIYTGGANSILGKKNSIYEKPSGKYVLPVQRLYRPLMAQP